MKGYPNRLVEIIYKNSGVKLSTAQRIADAIFGEGFLLVEPAQLEVLGDEEIRNQIEYLYTHNPHLPIESMLIALCGSISQATNAHNEAKWQLHRRIE